MSAEVAVRLGKAFGNGSGIWLRMPSAYDEWHAHRTVDTSKVPKLRVACRAVVVRQLPSRVEDLKGMSTSVSDLHYVDLPALQHLASGPTFDIEQCAPVLDCALQDLNRQTGLPDQLVAWIRSGGLAASPCPYDRRGRIIVVIEQTSNSKNECGYFTTVLRKTDERETAPVVFFNMRSPILDIPMRVEVPLRAVILGNPPLQGTYSLYLHALLTNRGESYVYYGITKRGWSLRFNEHMRAAFAQKSKRLLASTLNSLIEARVAELHGETDDRPKLAGLVSAVCCVGMTRSAALSAEERMVDKYSLASKHPCGLNMIPGGLAGSKQARHMLSPSSSQTASPKNPPLR